MYQVISCHNPPTPDNIIHLHLFFQQSIPPVIKRVILQHNIKGWYKLPPPTRVMCCCKIAEVVLVKFLAQQHHQQRSLYTGIEIEDF